MATRKPPMKKSEESTKEQLALAKKQGDAFGEALQAMNKESGATVQRASEYEIAVVIEDAEGMWVPKNGSLDWHPWIYHYGRNWAVPGKGDYKVHVRVEAPTFPRHDHENGRRYTEPVEADFTISVEPAQKLVEQEG